VPNGPSEARDVGDGTAVSLGQAARVWGRIGLLSFGGPAGQIALMHRELVEERRWIDEARFLHALNYCMLLPGPEAQQLAIYVGWLMHRTAGGLIAGLLFIAPGVVAMLALSALYAGLRELSIVAALFFGLKAAVLAIVVEAVLRIGRRALRSRALVAVAAVAFVAIFALHVRFPLVVLGAGLWGWLDARRRRLADEPPAAEAADADTAIGRALARDDAHTRPSRRRAVRTLAVCAVLWGAPLAVLAALVGAASVFVELGVYFSQAAVVTFGGAYAVLAYVAQRAVDSYGWLAPGEMLDGLGLAETTPGPLILVLQFVGFLGAFRDPGGLPPMLAGVLGSLITLWVTFVPCFLWIFLGGPYVEALRGRAGPRAALSAITAAVVGVILNLSIWFALHVLFREVDTARLGPIALPIPRLASVEPYAVVLAGLALVAMFRWKLGVPRTLLGCAALGLALRLLGSR
jgi:chromate transporter